MLRNRSFWQRPEGITGGFVLGAIAALLGIVAWANIDLVGSLLQNSVNLGVALALFAGAIFLVLDSSFRNLVGYAFKSLMRKLTSIFVKIDPLGTLRSYVEHLEGSLVKMRRQIVQLRQQMHKLKEVIVTNQRGIEQNLNQASTARDGNEQMQVALKTRKAGRLQDSNMRLDDLYKRMEAMYLVLVRMEENSTLLVEDTKDQVTIKETEAKAIASSNSAMRSAMDIIKGDSEEKKIFEAAVETLADDVSQKIGEMERFMDMSNNVMNAIDLKNGVFEEEGMSMLDKWEAESKRMLEQKAGPPAALDLNAPKAMPAQGSAQKGNQYDELFR